MSAQRTWLAALFLIVANGCGGVTSEEIDAAYDCIKVGNLKDLQALLADKPAIANAMYDENSSLLELVVDLRPPFPNYHDTIKVLLENGADPNLEAPEILRKAIWRGEPEIVEMLLEHGADPTIVSPKRKMNMLEYARGTGDKRFKPIVDAWEANSKS